MKKNRSFARYIRIPLANVLLQTSVVLCSCFAPLTGATQPFRVLHVFTTPSNHPSWLTLSGNTLYGTTLPDPASAGLLFKIGTDGSAYTTLKIFTNAAIEGASPSSPLLLAGTRLYGTMITGGAFDVGTLFAIDADGGGFSVLHQFDRTYGGSPRGPLALSGGMLYGTAIGGTHQTLYKVNTDGSGYTVLRTTSDYDWGYNAGGLVLSGTTLYGASPVNSSGPVFLSGTVFRLETDGTGYALLKSFSGESEGRYPIALQLSGPTLYGICAGDPSYGNVFKLNTDGTDFSVLKTFSVPAQGTNPTTLVLSGTKLYGSTRGSGYGTIFALNTDGTCFNVLKQFTSPPPNGIYPNIFVVDGPTLFGTTYSAGPSNYGEVFSLTLSPPAITDAPHSQTSEIGSKAKFTVSATGFPLPSYQWYFNDALIADATGTVLRVADLQAAQSGAYSVVVSNFVGSITNTAMLNVIAPVERRPAPALALKGEIGSFLHLDYSSALGSSPLWTVLAITQLTNIPQWNFDATALLTEPRFYRSWQTNTTITTPALDIYLVPAISLTGAVGANIRLDYINAIGPTGAWVNLSTVVLQQTSQLYFDVSALDQPPRLYRVVPVP